MTTAATLRIIFRTLRPSRCTVFSQSTYSYSSDIVSNSFRSFVNFSVTSVVQIIFHFQRTRSKIRRLPPQRLASSSEPFRPSAVPSFTILPGYSSFPFYIFLSSFSFLPISSLPPPFSSLIGLRASLNARWPRAKKLVSY